MMALMTAREVAALLNVRPKRVYELGIPHVQISQRAKRWDRNAVLAWINQHSQKGGWPKCE
jgi:hypothetical protein